MRRMPNIEITPKQYASMLSKVKDGGGEGIICPSGKNTLYKFFMDENGNLCPMSDNKQKKIVVLYRKQPLYTVEPLATISCIGEMVGYEITHDFDDISLNELCNVPRKDLIRFLRLSREALLYFAQEDITYGDVTEDNLLINRKTGKIKFCDIDNMRVGIYPIDVKGFSLSRYYEKVGVIDELADAYMHNLLTLRSLSYPKGRYDTSIMNDLRKGIYPSKYKLHAREIFQSMANPETFTGEYLIKYLKR